MTVTARKRVLAAVWISAGWMLLVRGLPYLGLVPSDHVVGLEGAQIPVALLAAAVVGVLKGTTVLRRSAHRAVRDMAAAGPMAPLSTVFRPTMVLFVLAMIGLGMALRLAPYPDPLKAWVVGILYPGIALGLNLGGAAMLRFEPPST